MENGSRSRRPKTINDVIHGFIHIGGRCLDVLDTPQFQRLRYIKQLQACNYVYPAAQHTRLEHSLGTFHLAGTLTRRLRAQQPGLEITDEDVEAVEMAGLCHDLGHGCFSHMLDYEIYPRLVSGFNWKHEQRSVELLDYLVDLNAIDCDKSMLATVESLILADKSKAILDYSGKQFLWDIVNNDRHGIDVDKFDYLTRDSRQCRIAIAFDQTRVMELMRVVDDEICFNSRGAESVYDLFHARSRMYSQAYFHKATRAVERMIADALLEANHKLRLQDTIHNLPKFCKLDDTLLREISRSEDPSLEASRRLIERIEHRQLYRYVDEFVVPLPAAEHFRGVTADDILRHRPAMSTITASDVVVQNLQIDYGRGTQNPVDRVSFFDDREVEPRKVKIPRDSISTQIPQSFMDIAVRLYIKHPSHQLEAEAREAFSQYQQRTFGKEVMRTPSLKRRREEEGEEGEEVNLSQTQTPASQRALLV